jgi:cytosine/uracil/thiamine/allantoin permease
MVHMLLCMLLQNICQATVIFLVVLLVVHSSLSNLLTSQLIAERAIDGAVMGNLETWLLLRSLRTFITSFATSESNCIDLSSMARATA